MTGLMKDYLHYAAANASGTPSVFTGEWEFWQNNTNGNLYAYNLHLASWAALSLIAIDYPKRATCWHDQALFTSGTPAIGLDTNQNYLTYTVVNSPANGDTFTHSVLLRAGTYTLSTLGVTANNRAKLDWYMDGVLQTGGQDWYSAGTTYNVILTQTVTVVGDGYHVLKGVVNGKNASSGNFFISLTKYWLRQASD